MARKKLPVLSENKPEEGDKRPGWQWAFFGSVLIFTAWLPAASISGKIAMRFSRPILGEIRTQEDLLAVIQALSVPERNKLALIGFASAGFSMVVAAIAGGFVMGKFGRRENGSLTSAWEAFLAGTIVALFSGAWVALLSRTFHPAFFLPALLLVPGAVIGQRWGRPDTSRPDTRGSA